MYIEQSDIFKATDGGLKILLHYFPQAQSCVGRKGKKFKVRETEKTASATLKQLQDGNWVVTDFGGDQKPKNGIHICMEEEGVDFKEALQLLASRYGVSGETKFEILKPEISSRDAKPQENDGEWYFEVRKDFTEFEIRTVLAEKVVPVLRNKEGKVVKDSSGIAAIDTDKVYKVFRRYHFYSLISYSVVKNRKVTTIAATEKYPIYMWDEGDFKKIYQPLSPDKGRRFMYYGKRKSDFLHGLSVCNMAYEDLQESDDFEDDEEQTKAKKKKKLPEIIYCSGGSDAMNLAMISYQVVWPNSETAKLTDKLFKKLQAICEKVMNMPDIDFTGKREAHRLAMEHLDLHTITLPEDLRSFPDKRGNPSKDVRDYLKHFNYYDFKQLVRTAIPYRFWDEVHWVDKAGNWQSKFQEKNTRLYNFLTNNGFYRLENKNEKMGYIFIQIQDNIVREIEVNEVKTYINNFLENRYLDEGLRDVFYRSSQLKDASMSNLPMTEVDFTDYDKDTQFFFFENKTVEVSKEAIKVHKLGEVQKYVWHDEVIEHRFKPQDPHFKVSKTDDGQWDIDILKTDNTFLNFLINTSRTHWRKELEDALEGKTAEEIAKYKKENLFNIAGPNLDKEEILEQKHHLVNKMYVLGYLLHRYKDPSRPWAIYTMDHRISDEGESHGGSGKSIAMGSVSRFMKSVTLRGRDPKMTENPHMYDRVTIHTDYILVDDANQYLKFDVFFSDITGNMIVNPKNNKSYEIPYEESPKFAFSSNFPLRNIDSSTLRRILYCVFADYYHENKDGYFNESRNPREEFGKNILGPDYTAEEWNDFYNFMIQCCQLYMQHSKIDPPMENVEKRNLLSEMGPAFHEWGDTYLADRLNEFVTKKYAFEDYIKTSGSKWTSQKFTKALRAWVRYYGYELDPEEFHNASGRIIRKIDVNGTPTSMEMIYISSSGEEGNTETPSAVKIPPTPGNENLTPGDDTEALEAF
ncbi:hypothetical protein GCM10027284_09140 [Cyclobacterium sediminis]